MLPIIERELRVKARSRATHWTRFAVALVGMLFCLPQLLAPATFAPAATIGRGVFNGMVWAGFVLCCASCLLTADVVGSERRDGTLGLLLLTRVNRLDVLLGKFGSVGLTSLAVLVALLPMSLLPVLAGGVSAREALRKGAGLLNALFFALAAGLFCSALIRERPKAAGWALGLVAAMVIFPPFLDLGIRGRSFPAALGLASPLFLITWERNQPFSAWTISLMMVQAMSWLLLMGAGVGLRRAMREESGAAASPAPVAAAEAPARGRWQPLEGGAGVVEWLVCRQAGIKAAIWTAMSVSILYQFLSSWFYRSAGGLWLLRYGAMMLPTLAVSLFNGTLLAWAASRFFLQARQSGELELLQTTPLGAETIISGQWRALKRLLRWPVVVFLVTLMLRMLWELALQRGAGSSIVYYGCWVLLAAPYILLEVGAQCWTGMWFGLRASRPATAIAWTVGLTRGGAFLFSVLGQVPIGILLGYSGLRAVSFSRVFWLIPEVATLCFFLWLIRRSRRQLYRRLAGAEPPDLELWQPMLAALRKARHWTPG